MNRTVSILKQSVKSMAEGLFPKATYERRYRMWVETEPELQLLPAICKTEATAIDIGANEGFFSGHLLPVSAKVVAFEPLPQMLSRLRARYGNRIEIIGVVLSDRAGEAELKFQRGGYMTATIAETNLSASQSGAVVETVKAPMRTLDSYELNNVGFIKIDVEGHEEAVLRGGQKTLQREMPNLMIEIEERHAPGSLERTAAFLGEIGYAGFYLKQGALLPAASFDHALDQVVDESQTGRYINNFLFFPHNQVASILASAQSRLQQTASGKTRQHQ